MLDEASTGEFERSPIGRFTATPSCILWCASPSLVGWHVWGKPDEDETRTLLRLMTQYPKVGSAFDIVADTRGVEVVGAAALALLVRWLIQHRGELARRVRVQVNVIQSDSIGFLLTGIIASLGGLHPFRTYGEPTEAFRSVAGDAGTALSEEIEAIVSRVRAVPHEVTVVRNLLGSNVATTIEDAAKALSTSPRSLQRVLQRHGTSFHDIQADARFVLAKALLASGSDKVASVAYRVGWSERTLTSIFRARTGLTPTDWRKHPADD